MNDFWARNLSGAPRPQQPQRGGLGPSGTPWWASTAYGQGAPVQPAQPYEQQQQPPAEYVTVRAASATVDSRCPGCGRDSYFRPTPNSQPRCFHCGDQDRFRQSMAGVAALNDGTEKVKASIYQVSGSYQPGVIVGKL